MRTLFVGTATLPQPPCADGDVERAEAVNERRDIVRLDVHDHIPDVGQRLKVLPGDIYAARGEHLVDRRQSGFPSSRMPAEQPER